MGLLESNNLVELLGQTITRGIWCSYDMINPGDTFGLMMQQNLRGAGYHIPGFIDFPSLESHEFRFKSNGWPEAVSISMMSAYDCVISAGEIKAINKIEMLDEIEEWSMIMNHYCITVATNCGELGKLIVL